MSLTLFVGNSGSWQTGAILAGLTSTRRRHDVDAQRYLMQLLTGLADTPVSQPDRWVPDE